MSEHVQGSGLLKGKRGHWTHHAPRGLARGTWIVWQVAADGKKTRFRRGLSPAAAADLASWCRDHCPDREVEQGINYLPGDGRGPVAVKA